MKSIMDKLLGTDWRTTVGGCVLAAGITISGLAPAGSKTQSAGMVLSAVGAALLGRFAKQEGGK